MITEKLLISVRIKFVCIRVEYRKTENDLFLTSVKIAAMLHCIVLQTLCVKGNATLCKNPVIPYMERWSDLFFILTQISRRGGTDEGCFVAERGFFDTEIPVGRME